MRHRCTGPARDHCRLCSFLPDPDDGPAPLWVIRMPLSSGTVYYTGHARDIGTIYTWSDDERRAKRFDCASHAHQFLAEHLAHCPAEVARLDN